MLWHDHPRLLVVLRDDDHRGLRRLLPGELTPALTLALALALALTLTLALALAPALALALTLTTDPDY